MSHDINSSLLMSRKSCINIAIHAGTYMAFTDACYRVPRTACANIEKLKSARNEHKNESFCSYENVVRLLNIVHNYFFRFCRIYAIIALKNDFVIH